MKTVHRDRLRLMFRRYRNGSQDEKLHYKIKILGYIECMLLEGIMDSDVQWKIFNILMY